MAELAERHEVKVRGHDRTIGHLEQYLLSAISALAEGAFASLVPR